LEYNRPGYVTTTTKQLASYRFVCPELTSLYAAKRHHHTTLLAATSNQNHCQHIRISSVQLLYDLVQ